MSDDHAPHDRVCLLAESACAVEEFGRSRVAREHRSPQIVDQRESFERFEYAGVEETVPPRGGVGDAKRPADQAIGPTVSPGTGR